MLISVFRNIGLLWESHKLCLPQSLFSEVFMQRFTTFSYLMLFFQKYQTSQSSQMSYLHSYFSLLQQHWHLQNPTAQRMRGDLPHPIPLWIKRITFIGYIVGFFLLKSLQDSSDKENPHTMFPWLTWMLSNLQTWRKWLTAYKKNRLQHWIRLSFDLLSTFYSKEASF